MLKSRADSPRIAGEIVRELVDHSVSFAHNRHLSNIKCKEIGLEIKELESDQDLQDKILTVHHIYCHTLSGTAALKIIENNLGVAFIQQAHQVVVPGNGVLRQQVPQTPASTPPTGGEAAVAVPMPVVAAKKGIKASPKAAKVAAKKRPPAKAQSKAKAKPRIGKP